MGGTAALGAGALTALGRMPQLFETLKLAGSLYVLWMGWRLFNARSVEGAKACTTPPTLQDGAMLLLLNPKAYAIIALMFSHFLADPLAGGASEVLQITTLFTLNTLIAFSLWTLLGDRLLRRLRDERHAQGLNRIFGTILALVALWLLIS